MFNRLLRVTMDMMKIPRDEVCPDMIDHMYLLRYKYAQYCDEGLHEFSSHLILEKEVGDNEI